MVIPAYGGQSGVDRTLAALAAQSYPGHLLEVVVVDDNTAPPLQLPEVRPSNCRLVRAPDNGWGTGHARAYGAHLATGEILCWLDSDLVPTVHHIEAHARWHHAHPEVVTLGIAYTQDPERAVAHPHVQDLVASTNGLCRIGHLGFQAYVGAASAVPRWLYEETGGLDPTLGPGQDLEFGYRLWQAGAVLVPERRAVAHYTDAAPQATLSRTRAPTRRLRTGRLAEVMPQPRSDRTPTAAQRATVPLVRVSVQALGYSVAQVRATVDSLLSEPGADLSVALVAPWSRLDTVADRAAQHSRELGREDLLELQLVQANYLGDSRVVFTESPPRTGFPSPYLLEIPTGVRLRPATVRWLIARSDRAQAGLLELSTAGEGKPARLWRCRSVTRALRVRECGESWAQAVARVHGRYRIRVEQEELEGPDGGGAPTPAAFVGLPELCSLAPPKPRWWAWLRRVRGWLRHCRFTPGRRSTAR
ncbi:glycosyltransferase [Lipingzhangella rawalii]|uniref:glycosyltransferase n=1 Tax=Lipingzhangella rawalii TaxID=2055835 RepID=UPI00287BC2C5|nr:glycosyltransferase family A protein [Lipingzhangella rawalii]